MPKVGIKCKLYYNSATYATPTWVEVKLIGDLAVNATWDTAEGTTRESRVKQLMNTVMVLGATGNIRVEPADAAYKKLRDAFTQDQTIDFLALNDDKAVIDTDGFRFDAVISDFSEEQGRGTGATFRSIAINPTVSANLPKLAVVGVGGTIAFTSL